MVVTGATGGVGSIAIDMLARAATRSWPSPARSRLTSYLTSLGASDVLRAEQLELGTRPLERARFAGAIDNLGGEVLTWLTRTVDFWGNIASIGLAGGAELKTTVMPFILRGVNCSASTLGDAARRAAGGVAAHRGRPRAAAPGAHRHAHHRFADLPGAFEAYIEGKVTGRTVVHSAARRKLPGIMIASTPARMSAGAKFRAALAAENARCRSSARSTPTRRAGASAPASARSTCPAAASRPARSACPTSASARSTTC